MGSKLNRPATVEYSNRIEVRPSTPPPAAPETAPDAPAAALARVDDRSRKAPDANCGRAGCPAELSVAGRLLCAHERAAHRQTTRGRKSRGHHPRLGRSGHAAARAQTDPGARARDERASSATSAGRAERATSRRPTSALEQPRRPGRRSTPSSRAGRRLAALFGERAERRAASVLRERTPRGRRPGDRPTTMPRAAPALRDRAARRRRWRLVARARSAPGAAVERAARAPAPRPRLAPDEIARARRGGARARRASALSRALARANVGVGRARARAAQLERVRRVAPEAACTATSDARGGAAGAARVVFAPGVAAFPLLSVVAHEMRWRLGARAPAAPLGAPRADARARGRRALPARARCGTTTRISPRRRRRRERGGAARRRRRSRGSTLRTGSRNIRCPTRATLLSRGSSARARARARAAANRVLGLAEARTSAPFTRALARGARVAGGDASFYPRTWWLPHQAAEMRARAPASDARRGASARLGRRRERGRGAAVCPRRRPWYIFKPDRGSEGELIRAASEPPRPGERLSATKQVAPGEAHAPRVGRAGVLQGAGDARRAQIRPAPVHARHRVRPAARALICREGLARASRPCRTRRRARNAGEVCMHVTNYTLNKREAGFVAAARGDEHGEGADKRSVTATFAALATRRVPVDELWRRIERAPRDASPRSGRARAARPRALRRRRPRRGGGRRRAPSHPCRGFQLVGLDVLFTAAPSRSASS